MYIHPGIAGSGFNHRVVKYTPEGQCLGQIGTGWRRPEIDQFSTPHTIASDEQGNIYVSGIAVTGA